MAVLVRAEFAPRLLGDHGCGGERRGDNDEGGPSDHGSLRYSSSFDAYDITYLEQPEDRPPF
jgi:hypothetical protein